MSQLGSKLRRTNQGHAHWCPACGEMHAIPDSWSFDGDANAPTFSPSVRLTGVQTIKENGEWNGEWVRDADGNAVPFCCHYVLTAGVLNYCGDCTHAMAGKQVALPDIPGYVSGTED